MAEFMPVRQRKTYSVRSGINERNCKELSRFNSESVDFLATQFLEEIECSWRWYIFLEDSKWKYF